MDYLPYVLPIFLGIVSHPILKQIGMSVGIPGVNYYAEVHTSSLNSYIHSIFMPFTIFGILLWFPCLFSTSIIKQNHIRVGLYLGYITHYLLIDMYVAFLVMLWYIPSLFYSIYYTNIWTHKMRKKRGFIIATVALIIQEYFGHFLGGDDPSRIVAIPNAILYACYYSVSHFAYRGWFIILLLLCGGYRFLFPHPTV